MTESQDAPVRIAPLRIAMWSGPRNISTAMMRSFENRPDCTVVDEPFYAAWLERTGADHPMAAEVIAAMDTDWRTVARALSEAPLPGGAVVQYQKHMTHHMLPDWTWDWARQVTHAFLIRDPAEVVASYHKARPTHPVTPEDVGIPQQAAIWRRLAEETGRPPPVVDAQDVLRNPEGMVRALCTALELAFTPAMLSWPPGRRVTDGAWAPHWYAAVEVSTGFQPYRPSLPDLTPALHAVAEACRPAYEALRDHRLVAEGAGEA